MKRAQEKHRAQVMAQLHDKMQARKKARARALIARSTCADQRLPNLATVDTPSKRDVDLLSDGSHNTDDSNGYDNKNPKEGRTYKDGTKTFYSGRLYSTANMASTQSNFLTR